MAYLSVRMNSGAEWRRLSRAMAAENKKIPEDIRTKLRETADPLVRRAQQKVLSFPTHGPKHTGLRGRVAKGIGAKVTARGVEVTVGMNKREEAGIPVGMDRPSGWRHPVFGNRSVWVTQHTGGDFFRSTMEDGRDDFRRGVQEVLDEAKRNIESAGGSR